MLIERSIQKDFGKASKVNGKLIMEVEFMFSVIRNCALKQLSLNNKLRPEDLGDLMGLAFQKIWTAADYDPTALKAQKLSYLKKTVSFAASDLLKQWKKIKTADPKDLNAGAVAPSQNKLDDHQALVSSKTNVLPFKKKKQK